MWYLFWAVVLGALGFGLAKLLAARRVLSAVAEGARRAAPPPDPTEAAYRQGAATILAELQGLGRVTPEQAAAWAALPMAQLEEQLLARGAVSVEQWDQLWQRHVTPALQAAEAARAMIGLDAELAAELDRARPKKGRGEAL